MEAVKEILARIGRPDYGEYLGDELTPQQWEQALADAKLAEQILNFTKEEQESWEAYLLGLRMEAHKLLGDAPIKAWENLMSGETFELNPERYWRRVIADLEARRAAREKLEAKLEEDARRYAAVTEAMMEMDLENNPPEKPDF
jgi:hypothetical protein